jgi:hypothetical protein
MENKTLQLAFYKGMGGKWGAIQFNLARPKLDENKEGAVFISATSTVAKNEYDWNQKINFKMGLTDLSKLLIGLKTGSSVDLLHDTNAGTETAGTLTKTLNFSSPKGIEEGGMISVSQKKEGVVLRHTIPLNGEEVLSLGILIQTAIPVILNWN